MELLLKRKHRTDKSTIGELSINGQFECYVLEDKDRGLDSTMPIAEIKAAKVYGATAIPAGRYRVAFTFSNRFQKYLPLLIDVPGYSGVRIHPGNASNHTEGCLLPGQSYTADFVGGSRAACAALFAKLKAVERKEQIWLTIE